MKDNIQMYTLLALVALFSTAIYQVQDNNSVDIKQFLQQEEQSIYEQYLDWKERFGKSKLSSTEDDYRFNTFKLNMEYIQKMNQKFQSEGESLRLGMGPFTDLSTEEYRQMLQKNQFISQGQYEEEEIFEQVEINEEEDIDDQGTKLEMGNHAPIDWRKKGAVTPVMWQGQCGSCWALACGMALESLNYIQNGRLVKLSPQMLLDCSARNNGCEGGEPHLGFQFTRQYGIDSMRDYPYVSGGSGYVYQCQMRNHSPAFQNKGYRVTGRITAQAIYERLQQQPLLVKVAADPEVFHHYSGGVIKQGQGCYGVLNHAIMITGFNTDSSGGYWIMKNNWGTGWGIGGYVQMQSVVNGQGVCGCQMYSSWPS